MSSIKIYTDGACKGNPGPGGWGAILLAGEHRREIFGGDPETTNNRMELMACIEALSLLKKPCNLELFTDSNYVIDGITKWMENWKKNNWRTSSKQPVKNAELWRRLDALADQHDIKWSWVKGHNGDELNERADFLANQGVRELGKSSVSCSPSGEQVAASGPVSEAATRPSGRAVIIHTDGSCLKNPGYGGWATIIEGDGVTSEISGAEADTTNNRMELMAAIQGLEGTSAPVVKLVTDSSYVMDGINKWLAGWKANGWKTKGDGPVKNIDLWTRLDRAMTGRRVDVEWVRGHSGHPLNERADELARGAAKALKERSLEGVTP